MTLSRHIRRNGRGLHVRHTADGLTLERTAPEYGDLAWLPELFPLTNRRDRRNAERVLRSASGQGRITTRRDAVEAITAAMTALSGG